MVGLNNLTTTVLAGVFAALMSAPAHAFVKTCANKDAGTWAFGEAPSGCDASSYGDTNRVQQIYGALIFDRRNPNELQRKDYVTNVYAVIRDATSLYIRRRQPKATQAQVDGWTRAFMTIANQESFLSHYRTGLDGKMKLMNGDNGNSHGMMQVNQRYHANRDRDNSLDLVGNITYAMDLFYSNFQQAQSAACVKRAKDKWTAALRSAYSIYNGGPDKVCRWTRKRDAWASNDKGWWDKYQHTPWKPLVSNSIKAAPLNVACLMENDEACANPEAAAAPVAGRTLILPDGKMCLLTKEKELSCVVDSRMFQCMQGFDPKSAEQRPIKLKIVPQPMRIVTATDRSALCKYTVPGLVVVGGVLKLNRDVPVKDQMDGAVIGTAKQGSAYQVLDFEIRSGRSERYYKVQFAKKLTGYIYGGTTTDYAQIAIADDSANAKILIPRPGSKIEIVNASGVTLKDFPNDQVEHSEKVPKGTRFVIGDVVVRQQTNELYLKVRHNGVDRYFYAGRTYPELSVDKWLKVIP
jgi:hypothetical protein